MSNTFFLILFTAVLYAIIRYFAYLTKDREAHEDGGQMNELFIGRLLFWLGGLTLLFFIYDIFRIQLAANPDYLVIGLGIIGLTLLVLVLLDILVIKFRKSHAQK